MNCIHSLVSWPLCIHGYCHYCEFLTLVTGLVLRLFVLYNLFPRLTAGLRGCVYYWQRQTVITVLSVHPLRWAFQKKKNKHCLPNCSHPWTVAAQKPAAKCILAVAASDRRNMVFTLQLWRLETNIPALNHDFVSMLAGMLLSPSTMAHFPILVMCGAMESHCGKCSPMESHPMERWLEQKWVYSMPSIVNGRCSH